MRVILEVISGPQAGSKMRLIAGQVLQVGRTEWADFAIGTDNLMSSRHFAIEAVQGTCQLRDLGSSNGTFHNGEQVHTAVLRDGDEIKAGITSFKVHIEGAVQRELPIPAPELPAATVLPVAVPPTAAIPAPARGQTIASYTAEPLGTGLVLYRGQVEQLPVSELVAALAKVAPVSLIVDFNRLEIQKPAVQQLQYLFDWLPIAAVESSSPVVLGPEAHVYTDVIDGSWGEDALVCVFSKLDQAALVAHLREMARSGSDSILGYCWPSVLSPLLSFYSTSFIERFMRGIDAILVEFADLPETWQIFARPDFETMLKKVGLRAESGQPASS